MIQDNEELHTFKCLRKAFQIHLSFLLYMFLINIQQDEEACTSEEAAWQDLGQSQEKARGQNSYKSRDSSSLHEKVLSNSLMMVGLGLVLSLLLCKPLDLKLTLCKWFGHLKPELLQYGQPWQPSEQLVRKPLDQKPPLLLASQVDLLRFEFCVKIYQGLWCIYSENCRRRRWTRDPTFGWCVILIMPPYCGVTGHVLVVRRGSSIFWLNHCVCWMYMHS